MGKLRVRYFKPIYVGFCILYLSKIVLYDFFYEFLKKKNGDEYHYYTDSLIIKMKTDNLYRFMKENIHEFDTSNYKTDNKFGIPIRESILGRMKDEFPNDIIVCFYGTGAKAYYISSLDIRQRLKRNSRIWWFDIEKDEYLHVHSEMKNKVALCHHDDKRFILPNTTKTLSSL